MSKKTYFYKPWGGVCIAHPTGILLHEILDGSVPHKGGALTEEEKLAAERHGTPQVCAKCRCLFQPVGWHEYEEYKG